MRIANSKYGEALPQLRGRELRAFGWRGQFHPLDIAVGLDPASEGAEAAIDAADHIFAPHRSWRAEP